MGVIPGTDFVELGERPDGAHIRRVDDTHINYIMVDECVVGWYTDMQAVAAEMILDWNEVMDEREAA